MLNLELMKAMLYVLCDRVPERNDAVYVFGRDCGDELLPKAAEIFRMGYTSQIVLNGLGKKDAEAGNIGYPGYEVWQRQLEELGMPPESISSVPPCVHTGEEAEAILRMASENRWKCVVIMGVAEHQLRIFLTLLAAAKKLGVDLSKISLFSCTEHQVDWQKFVYRKIIDGTNEAGLRAKQIDGEWERILRYGPQGIIAPIEELISYFKART